MPRLSVLLPVRNGQNTIRTAVRSTLRAMPRDSELVVFDDASTDATLAELDRVTDRRLSIIHGDEPYGVAGGLNRLLASTDSAIVARMDADDVCLPWRFRRQLAQLGSRVDALFTTVIDWHAPRGGVVPHAPIGIGPQAFPMHLVLGNPVSHPTLLATRESLVAVGGYRAVPAEDYDLWMRLHLGGFRLRRLAFPGLGYRIHEHQVSASDDWRRTSWASPLVASAYRDLTAQVLGTSFLRLNVLATTAGIDQAAFDEILGDFAASVRRASVSLGRERLFLLRAVKRRLVAARTLRSRSLSAEASGHGLR